MKRTEKVATARATAADGMVLLRNDQSALPLRPGCIVALLGATSYCPHRMGFGSGDMLSQPQVPYDRGLVNAGIAISQPFADRYRRHIRENAAAFSRINRDWGRWTTRFPEPQIPDAEFAALAGGRREMPAIVTIGRNCGESMDMTDGSGSFRLHPEEENLVRLACANFDTVIVLLNVCGAIDASFLDRYPVKAALVTGLAGETGGDAVADILTGAVTPSGKLAMTWARRYMDYPTTDCFGACDVPFHEGIYVGYRYFDTFGIEPRFPFGFGLSYTEFALEAGAPTINGTKVTASVKVSNRGAAKGATVVQAYLSAPDGKLEKPYQALCAYAKTDVLEPGASAGVELAFDLEDFASYDEAKAEFALEPGDYILRIGESSRDTHVAGVLSLGKRVATLRTQNRMAPDAVAKSALKLISKAGATPFGYKGEADEIASAPVAAIDPKAFKTLIAADPAKLERKEFRRRPGKKAVQLRDVRDGKATMEQFVAQFSDEELANCVNGIVFDDFHEDGALSGVGGVGDFRGKTRGEGSEIWHTPRYGIPANNCQDGPSGIRLSIFGEDPEMDTEAACLGVAYPSATTIAQTWDKRRALEFGRCIQDDMAQANLDGWLGAGANIQRNPLCGRNFEYPSEDPLLGGTQVGCAVAGVQTRADGRPSGRYATMKHFAVNSQEFERVGENNIVSERALREIFLKSFEWCVKTGAPLAVMTSYNRVNGEWTATSRDLLEGILRAEWGFDGFVMTDWWNGADPLRHCAAGNDIQMPGVKAKRDAIRDALKSGGIDRAEVQACVARIMSVVMRTSFEQAD